MSSTELENEAARAARARMEQGERDRLIEHLRSLYGDVVELQEDWRRTMEALLPFVEDEQVRETIKLITPKR